MGYSKELFLNHVDDEFTCSICLNVLEDPVQDGEEHTFCRTCITEWLNMPNRTCPISRNYLHAEQLKRPFRVMLNLLSKLEMKCSNENKGCREVFQLENYHSHLKECEYDPSRYFNCSTCGLPVPLKTLDREHNCLESLKDHVIEMQKGLEDKNKKILGLEINLSRSENLVKMFQKKYDHQNIETAHLKEKLSLYEHKIARIESSTKSHEALKETSVLDNTFKKKSKLPRLFSSAVSRHVVNSSTFSRSSLFSTGEIRRKKWNSSTLVNE